jgi:hypothetical protein
LPHSVSFSKVTNAPSRVPPPALCLPGSKLERHARKTCFVCAVLIREERNDPLNIYKVQELARKLLAEAWGALLGLHGEGV